jgi:CrcB protein
MQKLGFIFFAGGLGALSRYFLSGVVYRFLHPPFPYGTFIVNILGCFLFGFIFELADKKVFISSELKTILLVGFMGAFTTFSSFIFECFQLTKNQEWLFLTLNFLGQTILGFIFLFLGIILARLI